MRLSAPYPHIQASDPMGLLHPDWFRWLKDLFESLGWNPKLPVYSDAILQTLSLPSLATHDGSIELPELTAAGASSIKCLIGLIPPYVDGTNIVPFIEWMPSAGGNGDVVFSSGHSVSRPLSILGPEVTQSKTESSPGVASFIKRTEFEPIDGETLRKSDAGSIVFSRLGDDAGDTLAASVLVLRYGVKIRIEGIGHERLHP